MKKKEEQDLLAMLKDRSEKRTIPAGRRIAVLKEADAAGIASDSGLSLKEIHARALRIGIVPARYLRNGESIGPEDQLKLLEARIGVAGGGGLGGHVAILLARIGIGEIVIVDSDRFDETNLNRQLLASGDTMGRFKAETAAETIARVNPSVQAIPRVARIDSENAVSLFRGCHAVVDALDSVADRFILQAAATDLSIPMVHGALAGFSGQVMTVFPGDPGIREIYGDPAGKKRSDPTPEAIQGTPSITPAVVAAFQAMEVVKIVLGRGQVIRGRMVHLDLWNSELTPFDLHPVTDRS